MKNALIAKLDAAIGPPTNQTKKVFPFSPELTRETCRTVKFSIHDADIAELEKLDKARRKGADLVASFSHAQVKPELLRRRAVAGKKVLAGEEITPPTRSRIAEEFEAGRTLAKQIAMPAAAEQVEICRRIINDLAIEIEKNLNALSDHASTNLAKMLVADVEEISRVHRAQVDCLKMFAKKIKPSPWFNWRDCLSGFGIPLPK